MGFELSPMGSLSGELRRLRRIGIEHALSELRAGDRDVNQRIHEARKQLKRLRALLRLVSPELDKSVGAEDGILRAAARALSLSRDAVALHEALDELVAEQLESDRPRLAPHAEALHRALPSVAERDAAAATEQALALLQPLLGSPFPSSGEPLQWSSLGRGFRRTYGRARRALDRSLAEPTSEHLHRFRIQVKRHQHQLDLLTPIWPKVVGARRHEASRLGELIGSEHDLSQLVTELARVDVPDETVRALSPLLSERRQRLCSEALRLGQRAFAEPPRRIAARFETYVAVWREEARSARSVRSTNGSAEAPGIALEPSKRATA
jgi:CHAD domain-containing protein